MLRIKLAHVFTLGSRPNSMLGAKADEDVRKVSEDVILSPKLGEFVSMLDKQSVCEW